MAKKKTYNPFKMWGSYVGAVLLYLSSLMFGINYYNFYYVTLWQKVLHLPSVSFSPIILTLILGFLAGWGVHSWFRKIT